MIPPGFDSPTLPSRELHVRLVGEATTKNSMYMCKPTTYPISSYVRTHTIPVLFWYVRGVRSQTGKRGTRKAERWRADRRRQGFVVRKAKSLMDNWLEFCSHPPYYTYDVASRRLKVAASDTHRMIERRSRCARRMRVLMNTFEGVRILRSFYRSTSR